MKKIYLDNAATTKVIPQVLKVMLPFYSDNYGNPSEYHYLGRKAKMALEKSRKKVSRLLGAQSEDIIFTSGATESINLAHKGLIDGLGWEKNRKPHIVTTSIEHKAVLETCKHLERDGKVSVTYMPVDHYGLVDPEQISKALTANTVLVSVMYVNNEVGTIQPIEKISHLIKQYNSTTGDRIYFHTDATQAAGYLDCRVNKLGVDLLSLTGHKIHAPKGIGILFAKKGIPLLRQNDGGSQERRLRSGTENVAAIAGFAEALAISQLSVHKNTQRVKVLRDKLISGVSTIAGTQLTGHPAMRTPHIASFVIEGVEGEALVLALSDKGIYASSGSACTAADLNASHVLTAMGLPPEISHGSLRFSLSKETTEADIDFTLTELPKIIHKLRKMTPPKEYLTI